MLWPHKEDELDTFHQHLNSQHPSIQFTMEKESEGKISFLDVQIERKEGKFSTGVYRKITHTNRYINYASHHHPKTKTGVIACLRNRAEKVCDQQSLESELSHLKKTFRANGYPPGLISQELHRESPQPTQSNTNNQENQDQKVIYLPYVQQTSEHIQRICRQIGVKAVFKSQGTLREALMKVKNPRPQLLKKGVVYEVPCMDCNKSYIGETGRTLQKRLVEHKAAVRRGDTNNGIAVHAWDQQHRVDWENASVLRQQPGYWKRRVLEAIEIQRHAENTNLDCGMTLNSIWTPFLT